MNQKINREGREGCEANPGAMQGHAMRTSENYFLRQPNPNQFTTEDTEDTESKAFLRALCALRGELKITLAVFGLCAGMILHAAGVGQAGIGPRAVESFDLERPNTNTKDTETAKLSISGIKNPLANVTLPQELLKVGRDGRVQLFSVSRLTEQDLQNPFEVRVQVAVDVLETVIEIGGIVENEDAQKNSVILLTRPPKVRAAADSQKNTQGEKEKPVPNVYSIGDAVEGFRIHAISRDSIIVEQSDKFVEVVRGRPVTVCVPLSAL